MFHGFSMILSGSLENGMFFYAIWGFEYAFDVCFPRVILVWFMTIYGIALGLFGCCLCIKTIENLAILP